MRLFIALPLPAKTLASLESAQMLLRRQGVRGRFAPPDNLHLTLAFLGETPDPAPAIEATTRVPLPQTTLHFDRLTLFGDVLVLLLKKNDALEQYVRALRAALDEAGISYDRKAFRAHITLCRKTAFPTASFPLGDLARPLKNVLLPVREVRLMASDLSGGTPKYSVVFTQKIRSHEENE
ncbi:MAG: RNA 2',3'-cyclic phosphodiesterase [Clostridia bacterium]|nr:RNA 2',3'-cyclic phosphodiesterase [Clostridia bacterium]